MNRTTATQRLSSAGDAFWFSLGAYALLTEEPSRSQLASFNIQISDLNTITVSQGVVPSSRGTTYRIGFNAGLDHSSARQVVEHSFRQMLLQSFEITKEYAKAGGLSLSTAPWYKFARHYRNAVAHNGKWDIRNAGGLPFTWRNKTVSADLNGAPIDGYLNWFEGMQLCAQMINFVSQGIR